MSIKGDGYITKNGHTMLQFDIIQDLERGVKLEAICKWFDESLSEFGEGGFGISQEELVIFYNEYKEKLKEVSK